MYEENAKQATRLKASIGGETNAQLGKICWDWFTVILNQSMNENTRGSVRDIPALYPFRWVGACMPRSLITLRDMNDSNQEAVISG